MKLSIIDIGTQSLKHYIFDVSGSEKKLIHYKRYSEANLGESDPLSEAAIIRNSNILTECVVRNKEEGVEKIKILGTEILRKAANASDFTSKVSEIAGVDLEVISHDKEALYLYEGFIPLLPDDLKFGAMNIGGGSTEVVVGDKRKLAAAQKIPFGVKAMKNKFMTDAGLDWKGMDEYLAKEIILEETSDAAFVTGVLDFIREVGPKLGIAFNESSITNHPLSMTIEQYQNALDILRAAPLEKLQSMYPRDPHYGDNFATGQSVYMAICKKLGAQTIIPSNNDLTDGVIYELINI